MKNIVLIGLSGCGKTTIGRILSEELSMEFADTDEMIEKKEGKKIKDIFEEHSEAYFRDLETEAAKEISECENYVISTGGGIILKDENMKHLKQNSVTVYIKRSVESIKQTIDASNRPLMSRGLDRLYEMEKVRTPIYEKYADLVVINEEEPLKAANEIINCIIN